MVGIGGRPIVMVNTEIGARSKRWPGARRLGSDGRYSSNQCLAAMARTTPPTRPPALYSRRLVCSTREVVQVFCGVDANPPERIAISQTSKSGFALSAPGGCQCKDEQNTPT